MPIATDVERTVRDFFAREVMLEEEAAAIDPDQDLLAGGILTSLTLAHLIVFLEERYGLTVEPSDFEPESFRTLRDIGEFVAARRSDLAAGG